MKLCKTRDSSKEKCLYKKDDDEKVEMSSMGVAESGMFGLKRAPKEVGSRG